MPYTKETRIKHYRKDGVEYYEAQVKYKWPFVKMYCWEKFDISGDMILEIFVGQSLPCQAFHKAWQTGKDIKGLTWAKHIIDTYHNLCNNPPQKDAVLGHIKYPD